jgi:hypothetical protein
MTKHIVIKQDLTEKELLFVASSVPHENEFLIVYHKDLLSRDFEYQVRQTAFVSGWDYANPIFQKTPSGGRTGFVFGKYPQESQKAEEKGLCERITDAIRYFCQRFFR